MTVKRQHLVWRKYLAKWTDSLDTTSGSLFCYDIENNEIRHDSIEKLAVQSYAYDISTINENDKKIVTQYYKEYLEKNIKGVKISINLNDSDAIFQKDYIENNFISPIEKQGIPLLDELYDHKFPFDGPTELELVVEELKKI